MDTMDTMDIMDTMDNMNTIDTIDNMNTMDTVLLSQVWASSNSGQQQAVRKVYTG